MAVPLYGFLSGDTMGLVLIAHEDETVESLANKLVAASRVRSAPPVHLKVVYRNEVVDLRKTVGEVGFEALDRFDVLPRDIG